MITSTQAKQNVIIFNSTPSARQLLAKVYSAIEETSKNGLAILKLDIFMEHNDDLSVVCRFLNADRYVTDFDTHELRICW